MPTNENREAFDQFIAFLKVERGLSVNTVAAYASDLQKFFSFLKGLNLHDLREVSSSHISSFCEIRTKNGISAKSLHRSLSAIRRFFLFLRKIDLVLKNPAEDICLPKTEKKLPKPVDLSEIDKLLASVSSSSDPMTARDRAIIAVLYGCGLRVSELVSLKISDVDFTRGFLKTVGKGQKERVIPLNDKVSELLENLNTHRESLKAANSEFLFVGKGGFGLTRQAVWKILKKRALNCGFSISPHQLRHSFATHLLEGGINLRALQMLLGHDELSSTEIYLQVDKTKLKAMYERHHPRSKLSRREV